MPNPWRIGVNVFLATPPAWLTLSSLDFYERLPQGGYFSPLFTAVLSSSASALQTRKRAVYLYTFTGWQRPCCSGRKDTINFQLWDMREWKVFAMRSS